MFRPVSSVLPRSMVASRSTNASKSEAKVDFKPRRQTTMRQTIPFLGCCWMRQTTNAPECPCPHPPSSARKRSVWLRHVSEASPRTSQRSSISSVSSDARQALRHGTFGKQMAIRSSCARLVVSGRHSGSCWFITILCGVFGSLHCNHEPPPLAKFGRQSCVCMYSKKHCSKVCPSQLIL